MSSNGVTEPSSTSLILVIFSVITAFISWGALMKMVRNRMYISPNGTP